MPNFAPEIKNHITQLIYIDMNKSPYQLRYSLLLISVFAFALTSAQQALKLTSIVTDKADGAPLSHARVEVRSAEGNALAGGALTGADGKATIQQGGQIHREREPAGLQEAQWHGRLEVV